MTTAVVKCPKCQRPLEPGLFNTGALQPCGNCGAAVQAEVFPALLRTIGPGVEGERVMLEGEASCFFHPVKKAVRPCDACGRFLCALCDCEFHGQHYCPSCLEAGRKKGKIKSLENRRFRYDVLALSIVLLSLLFFTISIITAPVAIYICIRYWNAPLSVIRRTRARFIIALVLAVLEVIGWFFYIGFIVHGINSNNV